MFRALLAAVKPETCPDFVVDYAIALAAQHKLEMDSCSVIDLARLAPAEPVPLGGSAFKSERDEQIVASARQHAAEAMSRIGAASRAQGVTCFAEVKEGDTATVLAAAVQRCDLLVCGHTRGGDATEQSLLHSILKHAPRPAIIVPQADVSAGSAVLVAYDGSAQAARALASFADSGLAQGRAVHIASFDDGSGIARVHAETAKAFLRRHGVPSEIQIGMLAKDAGRLILDEAQHVSAGLIVMGAFGQSAVREFFFGSASRTILAVLPVPVFLDH
jgi:nucleotide-binding universal stress UspA family protein